MRFWFLTRFLIRLLWAMVRFWRAPAAGASFVHVHSCFVEGAASFVEACVVVSACVSVFVVLFILDRVDLVFVVAVNVVIRVVAVKGISEEEGNNRLAPSFTSALVPPLVLCIQLPI